MFDGKQIVYLDAPDIYLFGISLVLLGLVVWIRQGFLKEWRLADWLINNINRIWQRGADEVPQSEGILINHIAGIIAIAIIFWYNLTIYYGLAIGIGIIFSKQILFWGLNLFPKISQLGNEHNIIDRLSRLWMCLAIGLLSLVFSLVPEPEYFNPFLLFSIVWAISLLFRWFRVFQSANRRLNSFSYSFLYLCALEIFPVSAFVFYIKACTMWI